MMRFPTLGTERKLRWTKFAEHEGRGAFKAETASGAQIHAIIVVNPGKWRAACERRFDAAYPVLAPKTGKRRARRRAWLYRCSPGPAIHIPYVTIRPMLALPWGEPEA